jgi:hypothetical protein
MVWTSFHDELAKIAANKAVAGARGRKDPDGVARTIPVTVLREKNPTLLKLRRTGGLRLRKKNPKVPRGIV